jgi:hypothetical protein
MLAASVQVSVSALQLPDHSSALPHLLPFKCTLQHVGRLLVLNKPMKPNQ